MPSFLTQFLNSRLSEIQLSEIQLSEIQLSEIRRSEIRDLGDRLQAQAHQRSIPPITRPATSPCPAADQAGFSLLEALLAGVILLIMAIGILPLFIVSMNNNLKGRTSSDTSNEIRSELERMAQLTFDHADLVVLPGNTELETVTFFGCRVAGSCLEEINATVAAGTHLVATDVPLEWVDEATWGDRAGQLYRRVVTVRQYNLAALDDGLLDPDTEALDGSALPTTVHFKEIVIQLESYQRGAVPPIRYSIRSIKAV